MSNPRAFAHLLGRADAASSMDSGGGASAPVPASTPTTAPLQVNPSSSSGGLPDVVYSYYGDPTVFDLMTRQPVAVYLSDGYIPVMINGEPTETYNSIALSGIIGTVPIKQDNRGNVTPPSVYINAAALAAYSSQGVGYSAPLVNYAGAPAPAPATDGRQHIVDGPRQAATSPVTSANPANIPQPSAAPAPLVSPGTNVPGGQSPGAWTSDDGGAAAGGQTPGEAPAGNGGLVILGLIAAALFSR